MNRKTRTMWEKLKEEIKELYENNEDNSDIVFVTKYLLNVMKIFESKQ